MHSRSVCVYVCARPGETSPWIRHGPTVRDRQHMIGSHHPTKILQPITNLQFVLYMAWVGVGCGGGGGYGGLNTGRRPTKGIFSRPFLSPEISLSLSLCLFLFLCRKDIFLDWVDKVAKEYNSYFFCQLKSKENVRLVRWSDESGQWYKSNTYFTL